VPLLTIFFHVDIRYAIGASLVSVIATSSGAAASYVKEGFSNIRIGHVFWKSPRRSARCSEPSSPPASRPALWRSSSEAVLLYSAYVSRKARTQAQRSLPPDPLATRLRLNGSFPDLEGRRTYNVQRVPTGFSLMFGAGALSGLLGIGSGAVKVLAMDQAMRIPFKVSTTTSNFMIGVNRRRQRRRLPQPRIR